MAASNGTQGEQGRDRRPLLALSCVAGHEPGILP